LPTNVNQGDIGEEAAAKQDLMIQMGSVGQRELEGVAHLAEV
jgi:hypothetical protein